MLVLTCCRQSVFECCRHILLVGDGGDGTASGLGGDGGVRAPNLQHGKMPNELQ